MFTTVDEVCSLSNYIRTVSINGDKKENKNKSVSHLTNFHKQQSIMQLLTILAVSMISAFNKKNFGYKIGNIMYVDSSVITNLDPT